VFAAVAVIGAVTIAGLLAWLPADVGERGDLRAELSAFRRHRVWLVLGLTMVGFAAMFAVYSYVSPILTELGGFSEGWVTPVLGLFGVGTTVGTLLGGRLGDRYGFRFVTAGMLASGALLVAFAFLVRSPVAAVVLLVLFGAVGFAMGPTVQNGVIEASGLRGGSLVSAANQGAFNVANAVGAALGGLVISAGLGYTAPMWVGAALAAVGAGIAALAHRAERRATAPGDVPALPVRPDGRRPVADAA
jgi:DHA1 family inner membrane transport protein